MLKKLTVAACVVLSVAGLAWADPAPTPTPDVSSFVTYTTLANQGKAEVNKGVEAVAQVVVSITVGFAGFGLLIVGIRRAVLMVSVSRSDDDDPSDLHYLGMSQADYNAWTKELDGNGQPIRRTKKGGTF